MDASDIRTHLDRMELPDSVTGILLRVDSVTGEVERQGDIFDRGFGTARATEETVAQLLDDQGAVIVVPSNSHHPLIEKRTTWQTQEPSHAARAHMVKEISGRSAAHAADISRAAAHHRENGETPGSRFSTEVSGQGGMDSHRIRCRARSCIRRAMGEGLRSRVFPLRRRERNSRLDLQGEGRVVSAGVVGLNWRKFVTRVRPRS